MWVEPEFRHAGVGKALIDAAVEWSRSRGVRELKLMVTSVNRSAIAFYERMRFRMTGITGPYPKDPEFIEYETVLTLR
jgi:ribosomal protein S18 acetylase RimI-like enzyme